VASRYPFKADAGGPVKVSSDFAILEDGKENARNILRKTAAEALPTNPLKMIDKMSVKG
jgi:hypothetical protein